MKNKLDLIIEEAFESVDEELFYVKHSQSEEVDTMFLRTAVKTLIERAYKLGRDETNANWQSTMCEALNSVGYYKP